MRRRLLLCALLGALLGTLGTLSHPVSAGSRPAKCDMFDRARAVLQSSDRGAGARVVVIGDSFSVGAALPDRLEGWPSRLPGHVHVDGHSGSGFSHRSSPCGREYAFDRRAAEATAGGADLVVVQGGINDWDRTNAEIATGFADLMTALAGTPVLVVGPVLAPRLAPHVVRVNRVLRTQSRRHGVRYLSMIRMALPYGADAVHLTVEGHGLFGERVGAVLRRSMLPPDPPPPEPQRSPAADGR